MLNSKGSVRYYGTIKSFLSGMPDPEGSATIMPDPEGSATIMPNHKILSIQKSGTEEV